MARVQSLLPPWHFHGNFHNWVVCFQATQRKEFDTELERGHSDKLGCFARWYYISLWAPLKCSTEPTYTWTRSEGRRTRVRLPAELPRGSRGSERSSPWVPGRRGARSRRRSPGGCGRARLCSSIGPLPRHRRTEIKRRRHFYRLKLNSDCWLPTRAAQLT